MDLCFVSTAHEDTSRLPAVSGSSDRLALCGHRRCDETQEEPTRPGRIVEDQAVDYAVCVCIIYCRMCKVSPMLRTT